MMPAFAPKTPNLIAWIRQRLAPTPEHLLISVLAVGALAGALMSRLPAGGQLRLAVYAAMIAVVFAPLISWYVRVRLDALARSEAAKFRSLLDAAPEGVIGVNADGRIRFANAQSQRLFLYSEADLVGQPIELLMPDRYAETHVHIRSNYILEPCKRDMGSGLEVTARRRDGSEFPADVSINRIQTIEGTLVITMIRDMTAQRQHRAALVEANRKLQIGLAKNLRHAEQMRQLQQMAQDLQACRTAPELFACVARGSARLFPEHSGALYIKAATGDAAQAVATWGPDAAELAPCAGSGRCRALQGSHSSTSCDARQQAVDEEGSRAHDCPYDCVPMMDRGETIGTLHLGGRISASTRQSDDSHLEILQTIVDQAGLSLANLRLREALRMQSLSDPLTKLYNRRFLDEWLARELPRGNRSQRPTSLLMFDLDHFKRFNDRYGHECGDLVLQEVAGLLRRTVRQSDVACRIGGEELVLLLPETTLADALGIAEKLRGLIEALVVTYHLQTLERITVSIGVAESPRNGNSAALLLRAADLALYQAKSAGRNCVVAAANGMIGEISRPRRAPLRG